MCGRYSLATAEFSELQLELDLSIERDAGRAAGGRLEPRYNIAPTWAPGHEPPIVRTSPAGRRELVRARWWLIPGTWQGPLAKLPTAFNARAEELGRKRFWAPSFAARRCLVPATGWREFSGPSGHRIPHHFHYDHRLFAFAGVWDEWHSPEGGAICSFAIVTVPANEVVGSVHTRMPLRIDRSVYEAWLDPLLPGAEALAAACRAPSPPLSGYEADPIGNDVRREGPEVIAPRARRQLGLFGG